MATDKNPTPKRQPQCDSANVTGGNSPILARLHSVVVGDVKHSEIQPLHD